MSEDLTKKLPDTESDRLTLNPHHRSKAWTSHETILTQLWNESLRQTGRYSQLGVVIADSPIRHGSNDLRSFRTNDQAFRARSRRRSDGSQ